jgi:hypothetical protein
VIVGPTTIAATGRLVAAELRAGDDAAALRMAFDFVQAFDHVPASDRVGLVGEAPEPSGDRRFDALLAAVVEHLCAREDLVVPHWTQEPDRFLDTWWFVSGLRSLHASALVQSPISFVRRGVFICDGALSYA